jgi:hypothetical protein
MTRAACAALALLWLYYHRYPHPHPHRWTYYALETFGLINGLVTGAVLAPYLHNDLLGSLAVTALGMSGLHLGWVTAYYGTRHIQTDWDHEGPDFP